MRYKLVPGDVYVHTVADTHTQHTSLLTDVFNFKCAFVYNSQRYGLSKRDDGACLKLERVYVNRC